MCAHIRLAIAFHSVVNDVPPHSVRLGCTCMNRSFDRFVFHELVGTKIDNKVTFPLVDLDLGDYISGPKLTSSGSAGGALRYDLQSFVCHFGGKFSSNIADILY